MRSASDRSAIEWRAGLLVISRNGVDCTALSDSTSCAVPTVLSHIVASEVAPAAPKSTCADRIASAMAPVPPSVVHSGLSPGRPARPACFSTRRSCSITMMGR